MGSAAPMLLGVAPTTAAPAAQGEAPAAEGTNFLAALVASLSGAAVKSVTPLAGAQLTTAPSTEEPATDEDTPLELAAMIAGLLPGMAAAPENNPTLESGTETEGQLAGGDAAAAGKGATSLLDLLQLRAAAALKDARSTTATTATDLADQSATVMANALDAEALQTTLAAAATQPGVRADTAMAAASVATALPVDLAAAAPQSPNANFSSTLSTLAAPASTQQASTAQLPVHSALGTARWADEVSSRVVLMSLRGQSEGSLNLTPEHLGPLEVRISVNQNTANVWFGAQHADTRAALAEALPRLREMMSDAGLMLGHAGVSQEAPRQESRDADTARAAALQSGETVDGLDTAAQPITRRVVLGLVDTYA